MKSSLTLALVVVLAMSAGCFVKPALAISIADVQYSDSGDAALIYDTHNYIRQFHRLRSLLNVSYRVKARGVRVSGVECPSVDVIETFTIYSLRAGDYWIGCVENGYV